MNFKNILMLLVFTFISISVLCDDNLDDSDEGLEIYEELENLAKTNQEKGSQAVTLVNITVLYTCDTNSPFINVHTEPNIGDTNALALVLQVNRTGLRCTSLTKGIETGYYNFVPRVGANRTLALTNLRTWILKVNGMEILKQSGTIANDLNGQCNGAKVFLYDTITQNESAQCKSANGLVTQTTTTAVFKIKNRCESKCTGTITYGYAPPLMK